MRWFEYALWPLCAANIIMAIRLIIKSRRITKQLDHANALLARAKRAAFIAEARQNGSRGQHE